MSVIDDYLRDACPSQIAPLPSTGDQVAHARQVAEWAQQRHDALAARIRACHRVARSVTEGYRDGDAPSREELETAVCRLMGVVIDTYALSRQVIQACAAGNAGNAGNADAS